jgi:hypothetical protein
MCRRRDHARCRNRNDCDDASHHWLRRRQTAGAVSPVQAEKKGLQKTAFGAEKEGMTSLLNLLVGAGLAAAIVLGFWLLVSFIDDLQRAARR